MKLNDLIEKLTTLQNVLPESTVVVLDDIFARRPVESITVERVFPTADEKDYVTLLLASDFEDADKSVAVVRLTTNV